MMQVIKQTDEEKMVMYMKLPKEKIIEMLIQSNKALESRLDKIYVYSAPAIESSACTCINSRETPMINGIYICSICNRPIVQACL